MGWSSVCWEFPLPDPGLPGDERLHALASSERLLSTFVIGFAASEVGGRFAAHDQAVRDGDFQWAWRLVCASVEPPSLHPSAGRD